MIGKRILSAGLMALALATAGACTPSYEAIEVDWVSGPVAADVSSQAFSVPEGLVVVFSVDAKSRAGRRNYDATDRIELVSQEPAVARLEQGIATGTWMIMGVTPGSTTIEVWINGAREDEIPVDVTVQEVSP